MGSANSKPIADEHASQQNVAPVVVVESGSSSAVEETPTTTTTATNNNKESGSSGGGGCPMKRADGSYSYDWRALLFGSHPHGKKGSVPLDEKDGGKVVVDAQGNEVILQKESSSSSSTSSSSSSSACPVMHSSSDKSSSSSSSSSSACPVMHNNSKGAPSSSNAVQEYNVYSQPVLDPKNQMPKVANQLPAPNQTKTLSTDRVSSNIPKGGTDDSTWTYPSPQMFYNALARKGKLGDTEEDDIETIVALHNNMNEKTWNVILDWEAVLCGNDAEPPKLLKFMGRPKDLSPKATLKHYLLGHPLPYDRHDWTILRDNGELVRYVIDYYHDESRSSDDAALPKHDQENATPSLLIDVRPALDAPMRLIDRAIRMPMAYYTSGADSQFNPYLPLTPSSDMRSQVQESVDVWKNIQQGGGKKAEEENNNKNMLSANEQEELTAMMNKITPERAQEIAKSFSQILKDCNDAQLRVDNCESEEDCTKASMDLTLCLGKILCPLQYKGLVTTLQGDDDSDKGIDMALENVTSCVLLQTSQRQLAKEKYPQYFQTEP